MKPRNMDDFIRRDLERDMAYHERSLKKQQQAHKPPAPEPTIRFLDQVPDKPLTWLWPGRIPQGHLTLLDGAPGSGLSLVALTLAACLSSGSPLPDGTPTQRGYVLLLAPYDSPTDLLNARFRFPPGPRPPGRHHPQPGLLPGHPRSRQCHPGSHPLPACSRRSCPPDQLCSPADPLPAPVPCRPLALAWPSFSLAGGCSLS